ncbi:MAG: peptidoglycan-binding protein [bacterium]
MKKLLSGILAVLSIALVFNLATAIPAQAQALTLVSATFSRDLYLTSPLTKGDDVSALQSFLVNKGFKIKKITGNFGKETVAALIAYQTSKGISPANGRFGRATRAAVSADLAASNKTVGSSGSVSTTLPQLYLTGTSNPVVANNHIINQYDTVPVPLLNFNVKSEGGDSKLDAINVTMNASGTIPTTLYLYNSSGSLIKSMSTPAGYSRISSTFEFGLLNITVPNGSAQTYSIRGDIPANGISGSVASVNVNSIRYQQSNGTTVTTSGSPVVGAPQYFFSAAPQFALVSAPTSSATTHPYSGLTTLLNATFSMDITAYGGNMTQPVGSDFEVKYGISPQNAYTASNINVVTIPNGNISQNSTARVTVTASVPASAIPASGPYVFSINSIKYNIGGTTRLQTSGLENFKTPNAVMAIVGGTATPTLSITVLSPNGGETFTAGGKVNVTWKATNVPANSAMVIQAIGTYNETLAGDLANDGSETVTIPDYLMTGSYKIRVGCTMVNSEADCGPGSLAYSAGNVTINALPQFITLSKVEYGNPNVLSGSATEVVYSKNFSGCMTLMNENGTTISTSGVLCSDVGVKNASGSAQMPVTVGQRVKLCANSNLNLCSNVVAVNKYGVVAPNITILSPKADENFTLGKNVPYTWKWNAANAPKNPIALYWYNTALTQEVYGDTLTYNSSTPIQSGVIPYHAGINLQPGKYMIRICDGYANNNPYVTCDKSPVFNMVKSTVVEPIRSITVLSPNTFMTLKEGDTYTIKWSSKNLPSNAKVGVSIFRSDNQNATIVNDLPATQESYSWKVTPTFKDWGYGFLENKLSKLAQFLGVKVAEADGYTYKVAVGAYWTTSDSGGSVGDESDAYFAIDSASQSKITVTSPNGGETFKGASTLNINWKSSNVSNSTAIDVIRLRSYPGGVEYNLANYVLNDGQETVSIPSSVPFGSYALEMKTYVNGVLVTDSSDSYFKLLAPETQPTITLSSLPLSLTSLNQGQKNVELLKINARLSSGSTEITRIVATNIGQNSQSVLSNLGLYFTDKYGVTGKIASLSRTHLLNNQSYSNATQYDFDLPSYLPLEAGKDYVLTVMGDVAVDAKDNVNMQMGGIGTNTTVVGVGFYGPVLSIQRAITEPKITITSPNGGETLQVGKTYGVTWNSSPLPANSGFRLQLSYVIGGSVMEDVIGSNITGNSYQWTIPEKYFAPQISPSSFKMRVVADGPNVQSTNPPQDYSDGYFSVNWPVNAPTASITVNKRDTPTDLKHDIAIKSGTTLDFKWTGTNATNYTSTYQVTQSNTAKTCGPTAPTVWSANSSSGSTSFTYTSQYEGCTWVVVYYADGVVSDKITVTVVKSTPNSAAVINAVEWLMNWIRNGGSF